MMALARDQTPMVNPSLAAQLKRQLNFLKTSCALYDEGLTDEAIRIAVTIRVLLHQSKKSDSLLTLMGVHDRIKIISIVTPGSHEGAALFDGVSVLGLSGLLPNLNMARAALVTTSEWWETVLITSEPGTHHTRRSIVLDTANKDGGAHVAKTLPLDYEQLRTGIYSLARSDGAVRDLSDHHFIALRVMAAELLSSPELQCLAKE